jgi:hypothetical protein
MAWRPDHFVIAGELDNTLFGWTIGWLELSGFEFRLQLKLAGNCHPDLAGWKFRIQRIDPELPPKLNDDDNYDDEDNKKTVHSTIYSDQSGHVGDITADQMIKQFDMTDDEIVRRLMAGEKPTFTLQKCFYLEWFSNRNGRVVIQSTRLAVERLGVRAFELSDEQWKEQLRENSAEMHHFMNQLGDALGRSSSTHE